MGEQLRECPMCAGKAYLNKIVRDAWKGKSGMYVSCQRKSCRLSGRVYATSKRAIAAWNTRVDPQRQALVDVLKEIVTIANREYAVSIGNQWAWAKVEDKAEAALKAVGEC